MADYHGVPDPDLIRRGGLFVAEGRLVVRTLLAESRFRVRSVLVSPAARAGLADLLDPRSDDLPIYEAPPNVLSGIVGFDIHRGALALGERPAASPAGTLIESLPRRATIVVLEGIGNADNVGAIFRNVRALGASAVLIGPSCCDPLYRKAIRVSIGASLVVPFAEVTDWPGGLDALAQTGFAVVALTPAADGEPIDRFAERMRAQPRIALLLGAEGPGLSAAAQAHAHARVRIPMADGADSLNVATAGAIALHRLCGQT